MFQILEKTPFSIKYYPSKPFQPIAEFQVQIAEFDLELNKTHYYEQAVEVNKRFYYPREIAERIVAYWQKHYPFAQYKLQRRRTKRAPDVCHESPSKTHSWYGSSQGYVCEHCGTRR